jgi:hypothetical protein
LWTCWRLGRASNERVAIAGFFLLLNVSGALADDFCNGFERGYVTGYKQASGLSLDPLVPLCPLEQLKKLSDPDSDYEFGYTIGYRQGLAVGTADRAATIKVAHYRTAMPLPACGWLANLPADYLSGDGVERVRCG